MSILRGLAGLKRFGSSSRRSSLLSSARTTVDTDDWVGPQTPRAKKLYAAQRSRTRTRTARGRVRRTRAPRVRRARAPRKRTRRAAGKPSAAQMRARRLFAQRAKSGAFRRKRK